MGKLSIIIPTLQINLNVLNTLVGELVNDDMVGEVIIIDNSLNGYSYPSPKIKVFIPEENLYVNKSWNFGVKQANYEYVALLNDDILIPQNLISEVLIFFEKTKNIGFVGIESTSVIDNNESNFSDIPNSKSNLKFKPLKHIYDNKNYFWGTVIFFKKNNYYPIPEEMKIYCGDDYLLYMSAKSNKKNYALYNTTVKHLHSLSCANPEFSQIKKNDKKFFSNIDAHYKHFLETKRKKHKNSNKFVENIFSIKNSKNRKHKIITILWIKVKIKRKNKI